MNWNLVMKKYFFPKHSNKKNDIVCASNSSDVLPAEFVNHSQKVHVCVVFVQDVKLH